MKITIYQAISSLLPGAEFSIKDNDYDQIDWWDEVYQKPTKEESQDPMDEDSQSCRYTN